MAVIIREHPILFSTDMVKAILEGRKTQTRRVIKLPENCTPEQQNYLLYYNRYVIKECPYGLIGGSLWVRETWAESEYIYDRCFYKADGNSLPSNLKWRPSNFMPRKYSRITLEITDIRVQRVQEITNEDACYEGVKGIDKSNCLVIEWDYVTPFKILWDSINAKRGYSWDSNPWVWAISFRRIEVEDGRE